MEYGHSESDCFPRKRLKAVESLDAMIQKFPYEDPQYENLQEHMERVRAKFRQVDPFLFMMPMGGQITCVGQADKTPGLFFYYYIVGC